MVRVARQSTRRRTEAVADAVARAVAERERVRPPGAQHVDRRERVQPALRAERVRVLPHRVHAVDRDARDDYDLQRHGVVSANRMVVYMV